MSVPSGNIGHRISAARNPLIWLRSTFGTARSAILERLNPLRLGWQALSLSSQFFLAASIILVSTMAILGAWISAKIEAGVVRNTAVSTAFYMDSLIEPRLQGLATNPNLDEASMAQIDQVLHQTALGRTIATIKIWSLDGKVLYSTNKNQIGKTYPNTSGVIEAAANKIAAEFDDLGEAENFEEKKFNRPLLEVYNPIHQVGTNRVIAVAEMYQFGDELRADIAQTRWTTFLVVGASTVAMLALIYVIVRKGDATIRAQHAALEGQIGTLSDLLRKNEDLNQRVVTARKMTTLTNERLLRRVGADLHDGPAQLLGLALLYFDALAPSQAGTAPVAAPAKLEKFETVRGLLQDTLSEVRNISADIAPPELDKLSPAHTLNLAIRNHERRTGMAITEDTMHLPANLSIDLKTCLYRFVQEGLNNAFRHANGAEARVVARTENDLLIVEVADRGPGCGSGPARASCGLGLAGLQDRVEVNDGFLEVISRPGEGTRLVATFKIRSLGAISP